MVDDPTLTIPAFCEAESISRTQFYRMRKAGKGPRLHYIGTHPRVSAEARREWRRQLEAEAAERNGGAK
jgi:predicted DNA-binding transcriptional regulator AlpA